MTNLGAHLALALVPYAPEAERDELLAFAEPRSTEPRCLARLLLCQAVRRLELGDGAGARRALEAADPVLRRPLVEVDGPLMRLWAEVGARVRGRPREAGSG